MGIDARILIRGVNERVVTDEFLKGTSWLLVQAIGAQPFFISDGLLPDDYAKASEAWHKAFDAHPRGKDAMEGIPGAREAVIADIGEVPVCRRLAVERTLVRYREESDPAPGTVYMQDGPDIVAEPGECLLEVAVGGRYYGPGYERGDLLTYCAIAEWLEQNLPGCKVWYGGDSSGCCAEPFDEKARNAFKAHLYSARGRDYFIGFDRISNDGIPKPPPCGMCPGGIYRGNRHGFGPGYALYSCPGCDKSAVTKDGGKTWQPNEKD